MALTGADDLAVASLGLENSIEVIQPSVPQNVVVASTISTFTISWDYAAGSESFQVWESDTESGVYTLVADAVAALSKLLTGYASGTTRWFKVRSYNQNAGYSAFSTAVSGATTQDAPITAVGDTHLIVDGFLGNYLITDGYGGASSQQDQSGLFDEFAAILTVTTYLVTFKVRAP
jgi:hypothetical protein